MISGAPPVESEVAIPDEEIRAELDRLLSSGVFRRAERSRRFLAYVCDVTLRGESEKINEYLVGSEVFDRGSDYSPNEDSVVRRQAHNLRLKLDSYYANEGRDSSVRIELPVGQYVPVFKRASPSPQADIRGVARFSNLSLEKVVTGGLVLLAAFALGWLAGGRQASDSRAPLSGDMEQIWGPWLDDPRGAAICFANSTVAVVHHVPDASLEDSHPEHFRPSTDAEQAFRRSFGMAPGGYLYFRPSNVKTSIAESISAVALAEFFGRMGMPLSATQSRLINWEDLRDRNFIILGHNESNPWVDALLRNYPFGLGESQGVRRYIVNRVPSPDEAQRYEKQGGGGQGRAMAEYALISMLPGVSDSNRLLLVSGLDGQAAQLAAEYLTDSTFLRELVARLRSEDPTHEGEWHFQVVLEAVVRDRVPTRGKIVAVRVVNQSPVVVESTNLAAETP